MDITLKSFILEQKSVSIHFVKCLLKKIRYPALKKEWLVFLHYQELTKYKINLHLESSQRSFATCGR